jgi:hypothetical protein
VAEVGDHCGAATGCGGCYEVVAEIVDTEKRRLAVLNTIGDHDTQRPGLEQAQPARGLALTG